MLLIPTTWLLLISLLSSSVNSQSVPTADTISTAKTAIGNLINNERAGNELPLIGGFVRLAFHDCIGKGGCDGCIDHSNADNAGLKRFTDHLDGLFDATFNGQISRADFYALAAMTALEMATEGDNVENFVGFSRMQYGRKDCPSSPVEDDDDEDIPDSNLDMEEVTSYFSTNFGFNARETIALLGAHTLGRANTENSGYEGPWVRGPGQASTLNNVYYSEIVNRPWDQVQVATSQKIQWQIPPPTPGQITPNSAANRNGNQPNILLNVDSALLIDLNLDENDRSTCFMCANGRAPPNRQCCEKHIHSSITEGFATDNSAWLAEFTDVFLKMINRNDAFDTAEPTTTTTTTTAATTTATSTATDATTTTTRSPGPRPRPGPGGRGGGPGRGQRGRGQDAKSKDDLNNRVDALMSNLQQVEDEVQTLKEKLN